jgi:hypothetical protein
MATRNNNELSSQFKGIKNVCHCEQNEAMTDVFWAFYIKAKLVLRRFLARALLRQNIGVLLVVALHVAGHKLAAGAHAQLVLAGVGQAGFS